MKSPTAELTNGALVEYANPTLTHHTLYILVLFRLKLSLYSYFDITLFTFLSFLKLKILSQPTRVPFKTKHLS